MRPWALVLCLACFSYSVSAQSLNFNHVDSTKNLPGGLNYTLESSFSKWLGKTEPRVNGTLSYNLRLSLGKVKVLMAPTFYYGQQSANYLSSLHQGSNVPFNYRQNGKFGHQFIGQLGYHFSKSTSLDAGFAPFSDKQGFRGLMQNGTSVSQPYLRFQWRGERLSFTYFYSLLSNQTSLKDEGGRSFFSKQKGSIGHKLAYDNKWLHVAIFEQVVWAVKDSLSTRYFDPNYAIPFVPLRPVEFQTGSSDNVLVGAEGALKTSLGKFYVQLVLDEFKLKEALDGTGWWANKWALQIGYEKRFAWQENTLSFLLEHNRVRPFTFTHNFPSQGYSHRQNPIGHPLALNFTESLFRVAFTKNSWSGSLHQSYIQLGSRLAADGGDLLASNTTRARDFNYKDVENPDAYTYSEIQLSYRLGKDLGQLGLFAGARLKLANSDAYWFGFRFSKQLFTNTYAY